MLTELKQAIDRLLSEKPYIFIAVDGRCGSGKTTLANELGFTTLHTDDFFLRSEQRTEKRYAEAGGNIDYERFYSEVLLPLRENGKAQYRRFDCRTMTVCTSQTVIRERVIVVEGTYSMHPYFGDIYDIKIFMTTDCQKQLERISKRSPLLLERFKNEWIPMEEKYFSSFKIMEKCDIIIET